MTPFVTRLIGGLRALFRRPRVERELDEELRAYLESAMEQKMSAGMSRDEAVRAARVEIGSVEAVKDYMRDAGWESGLESVWQDIRYAVRSLRRARGFTAVAIGTLALGIGANTAIFSVVDAMLIHPLTDDARMRLVQVYYTQRAPGPQTARVTPSLSAFTNWQRANRVFDAMAVHRSERLTILDAPIERVQAGAATPQLFALFDASAVAGRLFTEDDATASVAVISYGAWQRRFGRDSAVVGRTVHFLEGDRAIIGVLPPEFTFSGPVDFWIPLVPTPIMHKMSGWGGQMIARLKSGVTLDEARLDVAAIARQLGPEPFPREYADTGVTLLHERAVAPARPMLFLLMGATGFTLLLACVNVAGLLVARGVNRTRELGVRVALGGGRLRIARQLLTESVTLAVLGGIAGVLLARWTLDAIVPLLPLAVPAELNPSVNLRVLGFTLAASMATGVLFGLLPALRMSKPTVAADFKDGAHSTLRWASRTGVTLVVIETALALVLLSGGGLMVRSLRNVLSVDPGFDTRRTLVIEAAPAIDGARPSGAVSAFYLDLIDRLHALPGVEAAGAVDMLPFWSNAMSTMEIAGREPAMTGLSNRYATPGYFRAIGMRLVAGRDFTLADRTGSPCVAIVNERTVRELWPGLDPLGRRVRPYRAPEWCEIVGIVNDIRHGGFERDGQPEIFFSALQGALDEHGDLTVVARAADPAALVAAARTVTGQLGVPAVIEQVAPFDHFVDRIVATRWSRAVLLSFLGGLGALLAALGIFGIAAYAVAQRATEFGIRVVLGATPARVVKTVLGAFVPAIGGGIVLGLAAAVALARVLAVLLPATPDRTGVISSPLTGNGGILFGITPTDPLTFTALSVLLMIVGLTACYLPARRATRVDPMVALRRD